MSAALDASRNGRQLVAGSDPAPGAVVVLEHADFDALADAWDDLWRRNPAATAFQSHAWSSAWARAYVPPGQLAAVVVWDGDILVAAAPLYRLRRGPVSVLVPLGAP
jgi:CelD/BcsL family acetyltransferase involved in cellulose biosynthesis